MGLLVSGQNPAAIKTAERNIFTATAGQTSFTITQGYQPGDVDVYLNGIRLVDTEDYIALNGSTVVLNEAATVGDSVVVVCFYPFSVTSHYTKSESDTRYVNAGGDTMTGALALPSGGLTVGTDQLIVDSFGRVTMPYQPVISGQIGTAMNSPSGAQKLAFDEFWVARGITYNSGTRRFTVPVAGLYRITFNPFFNTGQGQTRVLIGINNDAPGTQTHFGHAYRDNATYDTGCLSSVVSLSAGDYIVFYLAGGGLYNIPSDRFNQFSIAKIA